MTNKAVLKASVATTALTISLALWQSTAAAQIPQPVSGTGAIETVVVTAEKRSQDVQVVPATVDVIGGKALDDLGATALADYAGYVPGLGTLPGPAPGNSTLIIRGLSLPSPTALVGTYIDDAPFGSSGSLLSGSSHALDLLPYDIDHIEVLEGPQGTLYGANTMGGLVKYVTAKPKLDEFSARVGASISGVDNGNSIGWNFRGMVNIPLVTDQLALRASYTSNVTPGYIDFPVQNRESNNVVRQQGGRIALRYQPNANLTIDLSALLQFVSTPNVSTVTLKAGTFTPDTAPLSNSHTMPQPFSQRIEDYAATINYGLGWATATSATSWSTTASRNVVQAYAPIAPPGGYAYLTTANPGQKFTEELRLASPSEGPLEWLVGVYYTNEHGRQLQQSFATTSSGSILPNASPNLLNPLANFFFPSSYREMAAFANATWHIIDKFDVSGGARWSQNNQHFFDNISCSIMGAGACPPPPANPTVYSVGDFMNYEVSPAYHFTPDIMAYARVATGYRPGGPNPPVPAPFVAQTSFGSDNLTNYEVGLKSQWLDNTLQVNTSMYDIHWSKIQLTAQAGPFSYGTNGSAAKIQGFEVATLYDPIPNLHLGFNLTYTDAYISQSIPHPPSSLYGSVGDELPYVPRYSASATIDYSYALSTDWVARIGGGWRYMSDRFVTVNNASNCAPAIGAPPPTICLAFPSVPQLQSTSLFDAHIGVTSDLWTVTLLARNIGNEQAYVNATYLGGVGITDATPLTPRLIMLSVDRKL